MGLDDIDEVVAEHRHHFPDGFFARLGPCFLRRYYRTFLDGPTAVAAVWENRGEPQGYVVGILEPARHRHLVLQHHGRPLITLAVLGLARRPRLAVAFVRTRLPRYVRGWIRGRRAGVTRSSRRSSTTAGTPVAVLSHVAVHPPAQGAGLGHELVAYFERAARDAGCVRAVLVTSAADERAAAFYTGRGWTLTGHRETSEGRRLDDYALELVCP